MLFTQKFFLFLVLLHHLCHSWLSLSPEIGDCARRRKKRRLLLIGKKIVSYTNPLTWSEVCGSLIYGNLFPLRRFKAFSRRYKLES